MKKIKHITVNLTTEEAELIERIAEDLERKPAELARILLLRQARQLWQTMSQEQSAELVPNYKA